MTATDCDELLRLTPAQQAAVELVCAGRTDPDTAAAVGVHRVTVARWRLHHPAFRAAVNGRRAELASAAADRLRSLAAKALDAVERSLDGDAPLPAALAVLKAVGLAEPQTAPGPSDADALLAELVEAKLASDRAERLRCMSESDRRMLDLFPADPKRDAADRKTARDAVRKELIGRLSAAVG